MGARRVPALCGCRDQREVDALLVADRRCLTHSSMQMAGLKALTEGCGLQVYSPLNGLMELI